MFRREGERQNILFGTTVVPVEKIVEKEVPVEVIKEVIVEKEVLVVAEIGNNHEGIYSMAEEMIGLAADAGADAVKFQTITPERLVSVQQKERIQQLKKFQLSYDEFTQLSLVSIRLQPKQLKNNDK